MADKVLIIDDMELNRDMLSVILEGEYEIEVAEDGDLGIQKGSNRVNLYRTHLRLIAAWFPI